MATVEERILQALDGVNDPQTGQSLTKANLVRALNVEGDKVRFVLEIDQRDPAAMEPIRKAAEEACAHWTNYREDCIFDVMATGDLEIAKGGSLF